MTWIIALVLAVAAFAVGVIAFRLPRTSWTSLAAALVFGLTGYTLQASPDISAAPKSAAQEAYSDDWQIIDSRKTLIYGPLASSSDTVLVADGFARRGSFENAAGFYGHVVAENPRDFDAWVALGNALTEQADGALTQAGLYAFREAARIAPENPAPAYFIGLSLIRQGRMMEARQVWRGALEAMPQEDSEDAQAARAFLSQRVERLETMLAQAGAIPAPEPEANEPQ
ncbi:cytochrome C biosynthesis protein [Alteraurantiacibacter aquimixticola]|uniref:Cytochrome C biosynthesis protein n=1 Tax=Alteraurantiacibacter aquimixticola TaxID=2489173 RepID=A0A4T3F3U2_9SPHN|nr:cytochrome C biosynthesis protein [Alteraurantiacibacter aquimixticola]TIX51955.1 cytochrome C biosynthesis protein [Alteraurantiacibacter aquimixticola]